MRTTQSNRKEVSKTAQPAKPGDRKATEAINTMTIEEVREAEKAFNEELEIFKEVTRLNRKPKEE